MDRDNNYDRLIKSYDVIVNNKGEINESPKKYIEQSYEKEVIDDMDNSCRSRFIRLRFRK